MSTFIEPTIKNRDYIAYMFTKLEGIYIASSYAGSNHQSVHYANLSTGHSGGIDKNSPQFVCAIREF